MRWSESKSWRGTRSAGPSLRRTREIAEAWQSALAEGRRGEFGRAQEQLDRAERLAAGAGAIAAQQAVALARTELENRQKVAAPKVEALYTALAEGKWPQILTAAEAVLVSVPEHPAARQARSRAWQQIAAIGPGAAAQWPQRGARGAQAAAIAGGDAHGQPTEAGGTAEVEGIVWLNAAAKQEPGSSPPTPGGNALAGWLLAPSGCVTSHYRAVATARAGRDGRPHRPLPSLGRRRGRLSCVPGRLHRSRPSRIGQPCRCTAHGRPVAEPRHADA